MPPRRRTSDVLRALDQLVDHHVQGAEAGPLVNLAVVTVAQYSGAARTVLLREEGRGLEPVLVLGEDLLSVPPDTGNWDAGLVAAAADGLVPRAGPGGLAAPVLVGGKLHAVLYLGAGPAGLPPDAETLIRGAATTLAKLLHSVRLIGDVARRARNVETLEAIGSVLSAGTPTDHHLGQALDAAIAATQSPDGVLALLSPRGEVLDLHLRGDEAGLRRLAFDLAEHLTARRLEQARAEAGETALLEPLLGDVLVPDREALHRPPLGFLLVRRPAGARPGEADRTVLRALAHLVAAALARLEYYRKAASDALTGTGSRMALELAIVEKLEGARRSGRPLAALLVDVDCFKHINDTLGHLAGDEILKAVAVALQSRLRSADFVARFGGDEFLILLADTGPVEAAEVAEQLRARVAAQEHGAGRIRVTLSIGIACFPQHAARPRDLLRLADEALYRSKAAGRNAVTVATGPGPEPES